ncbi:MAG TPA: diadenylate cyclase CdaA [Verrucomicrobiae bacterium]|nr:diadenylate cyclase CdaA [Verrucomicrobiae bacterium]
MFTPFRNIGFADMVDILVVAILLYTAIVWIKNTRAAFIVRGIFIIAAVYILARYLDLQLTAWIFQGFFAIFLIIIVVIFQEELRQFFERIAVWSLTPKNERPLGSETVDILVRTAADLAKDRIGALLVIEGKDPIGRHIMGGIELGGKISEPLLKSIFDPSSPGHDGAVVIAGDRLVRFAAHLPLSKDFEQLANVGTRHSAALGLAELSDAICVVVSEEKGTISIARDGRLRGVENVQGLTSALQSFVQEKHPSDERGKISFSFVKENWATKVVTLSLALGLWYVLIPGSRTMEVTYKIPVRVQNLPQELRVETIQPTEVSATFIGPTRAFYFFDPGKLEVSVDLTASDAGRKTLRLSEQNVQYPKTLTLQELNPATLKISLRKALKEQAASSG